MEPISHVEAALIAERGLQSRASDPLRWFRWPSENHRKIAKAIFAGTECAVRAPNQSGKTQSGAYLAVALLRGARELDGEPLPALGTPNTGLLLVPSYKLASESSVKMLLDAIGEWPCKIESGSQGAVLGIRVKPDNSSSDDPAKWSRVIVHPEEGPLPTGMRLDFAWGDEPPAERYWRQIRGRRRANRPFPRFITFTPLERSRWEWLRTEFKPNPYPGKNGICEIKLNLWDNRFLGQAHIRAMERDFANDPLKDAVLEGEYVDTTGLCPFDPKGLSLWEQRCYPGEKVQFDSVHLPYPNEHTEVWDEPEDAEDYFIVCDPSGGIFDSRREHDPAGLVVVSRLNPRLAARYNGYRNADELGRLAAVLARRYNKAIVIHERNSSYGVPFLTGLGDYGNVWVEQRVDRASGITTPQIGWNTTQASRGTIVGALQKYVKEDRMLVRSQAVVDSLRNVVMGPDRKPVASDSYHDEDMIVLGLAAHLLETVPLYRGRTVKSPGEKFKEALGVRTRQRMDDPFTAF